MVWDCRMGNFCQISTELWHPIYDTISFPGTILSMRVLMGGPGIH